MLLNNTNNSINSYTNNSINSYTKITIKMSRTLSCKPTSNKSKFCKVCFDLGKTKEEYESHYVRATPDANAKITCPALLALECTYCRTPGHTVKYCKELSRDKKERERKEKQQQQEKEKEKEKVKKPKNQQPVNIFIHLCEGSSDSENDFAKKEKSTTNKVVHKTKEISAKQVIIKEDFPALSQKKPIQTIALKEPTIKFSAIVVSKTKQREEPIKEIVKQPTKVTATDTILSHHVVSNYPLTPTKSLFDRSDYISEDEDEEEDEEEEYEVIKNKGLIVYDASEFDEDW